MRALVLSGGGGLGAYQVGALTYMLGDRKLPYDIVVGVSVGSINGAEIAMWPIGEEPAAAESLCELWADLKTSDVMKYRFLQPLCLAWEPSLTTFEPLEKGALAHRLDVEKMRASGRKYQAVSVDIITGDFRVFSERCSQEQLVDGILGSSATPILHPSRHYDGSVLYDGGIRDVTPLGQAIGLGATHIDIVLTESPKLRPWEMGSDRLWNTAPRVFEIMYRELVNGDLCRLQDVNALVEARHPRGVGKKVITHNLVRPVDPLPGDAAKFEPDQTARLMEIGRADAIRVFGE